MSKKKQQKAKTPEIKPVFKVQKQSNDLHTETSKPSFFFKNNIVALLLIAALSMGIYAQSVGFDYVLDDTMVIVKNQFTQKGISGISDIFKYESFRGFYGEQKALVEGDRYRPLSIATFAIEQSLFGGNKTIAHGINILLYALTGILLYRVLLFMFPFKERQKWYFSIPFMATVLYMAHPLHTEVVANVKGRDEIIAFLGEMSALYFSFKYLNNKKSKYLILSFITFLIGILSKESAITFIAVVPLTLHFFTNASFGEKLKITMPILAGSFIYLLMRINAIGYLLDDKVVSDLMNNPFYGMSISEKTATIFHTFLIYFKLLIFPHPLTHDYYPYQIPISNWGMWQPILALILNMGLIVVILRGWKSKSIWAYSAAFYLITFSIVSNLFVSVGTFMNERFVYHASLGFCIALAYFLHNHFSIKNASPITHESTPITHESTPITHESTPITYESPNTEGVGKIAFAAFLIASIAFSIKTIIRVPDWRNGQTLNDSAIKYSPNSARANCFYAVSIWENTYMKLPKDVSENQKRAVLDTMMRYFTEAVRILPSFTQAHGMRAGVAAEYHKLDNNYDAMLPIFEEAGKAGTYQQFIFDYLDYITPRVDTKANAEKLKGYFERMLVFYKQNYSHTTMPAKYQQYLSMVQAKLLN